MLATAPSFTPNITPNCQPGLRPPVNAPSNTNDANTISTSSQFSIINATSEAPLLLRWARRAEDSGCGGADLGGNERRLRVTDAGGAISSSPLSSLATDSDVSPLPLSPSEDGERGRR